MAAVDEVVIKAELRDNASRGLAHLSGEVQRVDKSMVSAQKATARWNAHMRTFEQQSGGFNGAVGRMSVSVARFAGRDLQYASTGLIGLAAAAEGFGLKSAASFESSRIAFGTLLGSVQAGNDLFAQLQKFNLQTPFGLNDISSATQTLLQFGFAGNNVMATLKGISDVAALTDDPGGNLSHIAVALGQINGAGVLRAQDLNQLVQSGFPAYQLLQDITGQTAAEIRKQMESGLEIPAQKFIDAVQKQQGVLARYAGGAAAQAKTLRGVWSNFVDMLRTRLATAFTPLADSLTTMLPQFSDSLGRFIDQAAPALGQISLQLLDMLSRGMPALQALIVPVLGAISQMLTSPAMADLGPSLANLVTQFVPQIPALVDAFLQLVALLPSLVEVLAAALPIVKPLADASAGVSTTLSTIAHPQQAGAHGVLGALGNLPSLLSPGNLAYRAGASLFGSDGATTTVNPYTTDTSGQLKHPAMDMGGNTTINVDARNSASTVDMAAAVQQGIKNHEDQKRRRG